MRLLTFIGWELAGVSSYLLITYAYDRTTASTNATRALVTNRIGDAGFIIAIALSLFWVNSVEWPAILVVQHEPGETAGRPDHGRLPAGGTGQVGAATVRTLDHACAGRTDTLQRHFLWCSHGACRRLPGDPAATAV